MQQQALIAERIPLLQWGHFSVHVRWLFGLHVLWQEFLFLKRPSSIEIRWDFRIGSLASAWNPGAGSVRTTANEPSMGLSSIHDWMIARRSVSAFSCSMIRAVMQEEKHSWIIKNISCFSRFITSAANELPMVSSGSDVVCPVAKCGTFLSAEHWEIAAVILSMSFLYPKQIRTVS